MAFSSTVRVRSSEVGKRPGQKPWCWPLVSIAQSPKVTLQNRKEPELPVLVREQHPGQAKVQSCPL